MKRLTATICLTIVVLLGSAGMNYASSKDLNPNRDARSIWKGMEREKEIDDWVYKIKFNDSGDQYTVKITGPDGISPCSGRVEQDGTLSLSICESLNIGSSYTPKIQITGSVDTISLTTEIFNKDVFSGIAYYVTFDEFERKLAKFTQKNEVEPLAKLNKKQAEEKRQAGLDGSGPLVETLLERHDSWETTAGEWDPPRGHMTGLQWWNIAAEQGDFSAQFNLGTLYEKGLGVPQDYGTAVKWYRLAAEQGYVDAQYNLGWMYEKGQGVPQDYETAVKWYTRAAQQGNENAQLNLPNAQLNLPKAEEKRQAGLARKAAEAKRLAELKRIKAEEKRQAGLARKAAEAKRLAELNRKQAEEKRQEEKQDLAVIPPIEFGGYHALVIGNNDYAHLPKLKNAVQDARDVADVLERLYGFEVQTIENASRSDIIGALVKLRAKLTWDNNLLIYYAGHGTIDDYTSRGYWLPVEAEEEDLTNWVANSTITSMLKAIRAKHIMVVADSCYSGTLVRSAQGGLRTANDRDAWVQRASQKRSRTALVSGGIEPVMDGGGGKNSVFAKALLDVLRNNQSVIDGATLFDGLKRNVVLGSEQTPQYSDIRNAEHDGGEFFLVRKSAPLNQSSAPADADLLKAIKTECAALGFTKGTEKHGDCVMKLFR